MNEPNPLRWVWRLYAYIYCRMYDWNRRAWGEKDGPRYNVAVWLSLIFLVNVLNIDQIGELLFNRRVLDLFGETKLVPLGILAIGLAVHYIFLVRDSAFHKAETITSLFTSKQKSIIFRYLPLIYNVGSILIFFVLVLIRRPRG